MGTGGAQAVPCRAGPPRSCSPVCPWRDLGSPLRSSPHREKQEEAAWMLSKVSSAS